MKTLKTGDCLVIRHL